MKIGIDRMPIPLGNFISREVYNSKLLSRHSIGDKSCIAFIDASKGMEVSVGKSWSVRTHLLPRNSTNTKLISQNAAEVHIVVKLVQDYYRYKDYCVITPYDAQRAAIVKALQTARLPSDKVFNIDSFQGEKESIRCFILCADSTQVTRPNT